MTDKVEAAKAEETAKNPLEQTVKFSVSAAELKSGMDAELKRLSKKAKLPGFRPGHVPAATVQAMYGQEAYMEALNRLVGIAYDKAVAEAKLNVAGMPDIKSEETKEGEDLQFSATVECFPQFDLPSFEALELKKFACEITDVEVQKTIDIMVKQRPTYVVEEGHQCAADDKVTLNFKGTKDGVAFEGGSADGFVFVLAQGRMLPEFETAVTGMVEGEKKSFKLTFPKDYGAKQLAGQEAEFEVEVTKVEKAQFPAVDEAFAKSLGMESLEAMQKEVRANLEREVKSRTLTRTKNEVMEALNGLCTFAVPKAVVTEEQQRMAEAAKRDMAARGMDVKKTPALPLELFADQAQRRVRLGLFVAKLVEVNNLAGTQDDVKALVAEMASAYEKPEEMIEWMMKDRSRMADLFNVATENKVVEFVLAQAKTTTENVAFDQLMTGAAA